MFVRVNLEYALSKPRVINTDTISVIDEQERLVWFAGDGEASSGMKLMTESFDRLMILLSIKGEFRD